jgi:xanthine dehydrogenase large subunit
MERPTDPPPSSGATFPGPTARHESAHLHVTGQARYTDDLALPSGALHAALGISSIAHGRILELDLSAVRGAPGVVDVLVAGDIPGHNSYGPILDDDPILAEETVRYVGQPIFAVAATSMRAA